MLTPRQERNCSVSEGAARSYRKVLKEVKFWLIISKKLLAVLCISCGQVSEVMSLGILLDRVDNPQDDSGTLPHSQSGTGPRSDTALLTFSDFLTLCF